MTTEDSPTKKSPRSVTGGIGAATVGLGMFIAFIGFGRDDSSTLGIGFFVIGLGVFVALCAVTAYLFSSRN